MRTARTLALLFMVYLPGSAGLAQSEHPSLNPDVAARQAKRTAPDFSLKIRAVQDEIQSGSKVLVDVIIRNTLDEEIAMTSFHELGFRELIILDGKGKPALTKLGVELAAGREFLSGGHNKLFFVQPGKLETQTITVRSDIYDLTKPGKYTIQLQRFDTATKSWVKSNLITITVVS
jgi:hypothetical protein